MWDRVVEWAAAYGGRVLGAIITLVVGYFLARLARQLVKKLLARTRTPVEIQSFVSRLIYIAILAFAVIATLSRFGIEMTSLIAVLGAVAFAVGFALQGSLANFAAGVLLILLRPFKVGDFVELDGVAGVVKEIELFTTVLATLDNVKVCVPNGKICGETIRNFSAYGALRVDLPIGIAYSAPIESAAAVVHEVISGDQRVRKEPPHEVLVGELADSSVNLIVRFWVNPPDYWATPPAIRRRIKEAFDEHGIEIPFPQRVVHMSRE